MSPNVASNDGYKLLSRHMYEEISEVKQNYCAPALKFLDENRISASEVQR